MMTRETGDIVVNRVSGGRLAEIEVVARAQPAVRKAAMALRGKNAHARLAEIHVRHWQALAAQSGVPDAFAQMQAFVEHAPAGLDHVEAILPTDFSARVWDAVRAGVRSQVQRFHAELAATP